MPVRVGTIGLLASQFGVPGRRAPFMDTPAGVNQALMLTVVPGDYDPV
jgi:hypothetical protein